MTTHTATIKRAEPGVLHVLVDGEQVTAVADGAGFVTRVHRALTARGYHRQSAWAATADGASFTVRRYTETGA